MVLGRFIPALAGNSYHPASKATSFSVHPRACGEQIVERDIRQDSNGSSPRLRGKVKKVMFGHGFGLKSARACGEQ